MGKPIRAQPTDIRHPTINNRGAVADSANRGGNSRPVRTLVSGGRSWSVGYANAHPRLNPRYRSVRVLSGRLSQLLSYMSHRKGRERQAKGVMGLLIIHYVPIATNVRTGRFFNRQICSTSSTPNHGEISALPQVALRSTSGYAWFAISDGPSLRSLGVLIYAPTSSHRHRP